MFILLANKVYTCLWSSVFTARQHSLLCRERY